MIEPDTDPLFARLGERLGAATPSEHTRNDQHARVVHGMLIAERRHMRRTAYRRRVAIRACSVTAAAAVVFVMAWRPGNTSNAETGARAVTFRFDDMRAERVAVVGEFNGWNAQSTPMVRSTSGRWEARVSVPPGRHTYAFVVNDSTWVADPAAPSAPERWFGDPRSVLVVASVR